MADQQVIFKYYDEPVEYKVLENGTSRGKPLLVSSYGFTYVVRRKVPAQNKIQWRCSKRSKNLQCKAGVIQVGTSFALLKKHIHLPQPGAALKAEITAEVWFWEVKVQYFSVKCPSEWLMTNETVLVALYGLDASLSLLLLVLKRGYQKVAQCNFCSWHIDGRSTKVNFLLQK